MPALMIIGDGMADVPLSELGGHTPLEVAGCPNMARLCSKGRSGLIDPIGPGMVAESAEAIMTILGYGHYLTHLSRGPLEVLGAGLDLEEGDIAFRCNFSLVDEDLRIRNERVEVPENSRLDLIQSLQDYCRSSWGLDLVFKLTWRFKGVMLLKGENLSSEVITPPPRRGEEALAVRRLTEAADSTRTAMIINSIIEESNRILSKSGCPPGVDAPANILIPWGIGRRISLEPFSTKHGLKATCVAGASLVRGIGEACGMKVPLIAGATGGVDTNLEAKAEAAIEACKDHDFVLVHVGGPDEASHDGEVQSKVKIIKKIDSMLGDILERTSLEGILVTLLSDHTSSTALRRHTPHPTPIVITGSRMASDDVREYTESAASKGGLGRITGAMLMKTILGLVG